MTMFMVQEVTCAVCNAKGKYLVLTSTHQFGSPDLDLRQPPDARKAVLRAILRCKKCKYCASDLSECPESAPATIRSREYRTLLSQKRVPKVARRWACWSLVQDEAGEQVGAGWAILSAAWACDDAKRSEWAEVYRNRATDAFQTVRDAGGAFAEDRVVEELVLVDLLRRNGLFVAASHVLHDLELADAQEGFDQVPQFQLALLAHRDRRSYTFQDAKEYAESPDDWQPAPERIPWWRRIRLRP